MFQDAPLRLVNLQSEVAAPFLAAVADELAGRTGLSVRLDEAGDWTERRSRLLAGEAQLGFWCGLPYALEADRPAPRVALLAAPVMADSRYGNQAVYFSDVVVPRRGPVRAFHELRGARWAYNEPSSHSGYWLTRHELARRGLAPGFFGQVIEAGSHMRAIALVRAGEVDAAAIDSTVLELAIAADPALAADLRVIETLGPSAMPPLVASTRMPEETRRRLRLALLDLHLSAAGRDALALGLLSRFTSVSDADYDGIRGMAAIADATPLT